MFSPTPDIMKEEGWGYFRLCFAAIDEAELEKCSEGVVKGFRSFWEIKNLGDIEEDISVKMMERERFFAV